VLKAGVVDARNNVRWRDGRERARSVLTPGKMGGCGAAAAMRNAFSHAHPRTPSIHPQMPLEPNQVPCAGQRRPLPTARTASTIPKAGLAGGGTWAYPSPQMFFNALARKGKGGDVREEDMESVVHAHNCAF